MRTAGICFGSTTVQYVVVCAEGDHIRVEACHSIRHEGDPGCVFRNVHATLVAAGVDRVAITGRGFKSRIRLSAITEPQGVEYALAHEYRDGEFPHLCVSAGGETQLVYELGADGSVLGARSGNKCASGTGEFFLQQIRRMDISLEEAITLALEGTPHRIAGRCSVFCKSDCTHSLNKGVSRQDVVAGLCRMMTARICELTGECSQRRICLIGGGGRNRALVTFLREKVAALDVPELGWAFEAYGAALWAVHHECRDHSLPCEELFEPGGRSFEQLAPLSQGSARVEFRTLARVQPEPGDDCIVGLDVGSTTTKGVVMRRRDAAVLASAYLRTNGDPVGASRDCYAALEREIGGVPILISGLGTTGSGRQIAGLHALTDMVINEIIAHATAAAFFDPGVDTIFEIGGQDAKFTRLTNGVASDYAMNEACSAGTGSFLEEAAYETLGVPTSEISELALKGQAPPNFSDECSAFISSDIKRAGQEGVGRDDILAGLVYSVCLNYLNRVKGSRPAGSRIFMQGGVCYNRAVPAAMALLTGETIVVPPEPGLMGAFGVAREVAARQERHEGVAACFELGELAARDAEREATFVCGGGREGCDLGCEIVNYRINGSRYPFGGNCNRYYNLRLQNRVETLNLDYVEVRQRLLERFSSHGPLPATSPAVGLNGSFLNYTLLPLFSRFFAGLGMRVVVSQADTGGGVTRSDTSWCYPAQMAHRSFESLLDKRPAAIFLPHILQLPVPNVPTRSRTCVFVQGESYYLRATFRERLEALATPVISPVLVMQHSYRQALDAMVDAARGMGCDAEAARKAWMDACSHQYRFEEELREQGRHALAYLEEHPRMRGIVVLGRPYNALVPQLTMGIPRNVASRGHLVIPFDMLSWDHYEVDAKMFWAMGQKILKCTQLIREHPRLFALYITNFSCGPDSFLLTYFRDSMGEKPSLTLELDQHTASAGIDTRIEAWLDIIDRYAVREAVHQRPVDDFSPARLVDGDPPVVYASDGTRYELTDRNHVEVVIPAMGRYGPRGVAAILRGMGIHARALPTAGMAQLQEARRHASCKECLPYLVTSGSFLTYLRARRRSGGVTLLFIPTGGGPCRLGQYCRALEQTLHRLRIPDVAVLTVTDENGYGGLGNGGLLKAWQAIVISDVFDDIASMLAVTACDPRSARRTLDAMWLELERFFEGRYSVTLTVLLSGIAGRLGRIPVRRSPEGVPVISLIGEYYVRKDEFSRMNIVDYLQNEGFMVRVAPAMEYLLYSNYNVNRGLQEGTFSPAERLALRLRSRIQIWWERRIKSILARSGLYRFEMVDVARTIAGVRHLINENLRGETLLTVGSGMREILHDSCGIVAIGPFGCMPSRMSEAILKKELTPQGKERMPGGGSVPGQYRGLERFPFFSVETDGKPFPQIVEANLEAFVLQARRVHRLMHAGAQGGEKREEAQEVRCSPSGVVG